MNKEKRNKNPIALGAKTIKRLLTIREVQLIAGKSRSTLYRWISQGIFPKPCKIGPNSIAWPEEAIEQWRESNINNIQSV